MHRSTKRASVALSVVAIAAAACGGGGSSGGGGTTSPPSPGGSTPASNVTFHVGVLTDLTGAAAAGNKTTEAGVKAGVAAVSKDGYTITYDVADTTSSPTGTLAAAKTLVERDHAQAIIMQSGVGYAAASYLTQKGIPVIGFPEDGPEWAPSKNMFATTGPLHTTGVNTLEGIFLKKEGVTNLASIGYSISPTSAEATKASGISAVAAGIKSGYLNSAFPFGSTNVAPLALAIKNAHSDGIATFVDSNTSLALATALRNEGVSWKVFLLAQGYGSDILDAGAATIKAAQDTYFTSTWEPIEMNTPATQAFEGYLHQTGYTDAPDLAVYSGYASVLLLVEGLKGAGANPSSKDLITSLSKIKSFTSGGLFGSHPALPNDRTTVNDVNGNCSYFVKLVGSKFETVAGAEPLCGAPIPGKTVTP